MNYYLFIDESGDHGLNRIDPNFPVFVLCGVVISHEEYLLFDEKLKNLKSDFWSDKKVIIHSRDIRKCMGEFQVLFDLKKKELFYKGLNRIIEESDFRIISSAINKERYIEKYGKLGRDVYEVSLSLLLERTIFYLDGLKKSDTSLRIVIEKRGKKEDAQLSDHFNRLMGRGTHYVDVKRFKSYNTSFTFKDKKENINGLQLADLVAYPIARHVIDEDRANPAFDLIDAKFYRSSGGKKRYGLKIFP